MNIRVLRQSAIKRIREAGWEPIRLTFISTAVALALSLLSAWLNYYTIHYEGSGGLSDMGTVGILQTLDQTLSLLVGVFTPFWAFGLLHVLFHIANGDEVATGDLLFGLRRFGPVLRLMLVKCLFLMVLAFVMYLPSVILFMMTPSGQEFQKMVMADPDIMQDAQAMETLSALMDPMVIINVVLVVLAYIPVSYKLRLADFYVVTGCRGAFRAVITSFRNTRGHMLHLLKLDLGFWWYHLAGVLLTVVCYLDVLSGYLGIALPVDSAAAFWVCYLAYAAGHLALETFARPRVEAANVFFFRATAFKR